MHWFTEQDSKLVVKELPLFKWIMGFFFFLMFALVGSISLFDKNLPTLSAFFAFPFVLVCLYILYNFPIITVSIDRYKETVTVEKQTLFNYKIFTVRFREVNDLLSISAVNEKTVSGERAYRVKIPLENNPKMEKSMEFTTSNRDFHKAVKMMNDYLQKPRSRSMLEE